MSKRKPSRDSGAKQLVVNFIRPPAASPAPGSSFIPVLFLLRDKRGRGNRSSEISEREFSPAFILQFNEFFVIFSTAAISFSSVDRKKKFLLTLANSRERKPESRRKHGRRCTHVTLWFPGHVPQSRLSTFIFSQRNVFFRVASTTPYTALDYCSNSHISRVRQSSLYPFHQWFLMRILVSTLSLSNTPLIDR